MKIPVSFPRVLIAICLPLCAHAAGPEKLTPETLSTLAFDQKPGAQVPLDAIVRDESGANVRLGNLLEGMPSILVFADYECVHLCSVVLNGTLESVRQLRLNAGKDYQIIVISIRPEETPKTAAHRHHIYATRYGRGEQGWHFLVQGRTPVREIAQAVGFRYAFDPETQQFAHPSGIMVLTPEGKVSRYFQGIEYRAQSLQDALVEARQRKIGPIAERLLLLCFHYDPTTGKYGLVISRVIQISGIATVLGVLGLIWILRRREKNHEPALSP